MNLPNDEKLKVDQSLDLESLGLSKPPSERSFFTGNVFGTMRRHKGGSRPLVPAPPLPCHPPPVLPPDSRSIGSCYCSAPAHAQGACDSTYSEAHYTSTQRLHGQGTQYQQQLQLQRLQQQLQQQLMQQQQGPTHVYASTNPLPPCPDGSISSPRPLLPSPGGSHHPLCRNSAVYESASLQYSPAGYYLPTPVTVTPASASMTPSRSDSIADSESAGPPSLPSMTYEALRALGQDIEAFRQRQQRHDNALAASQDGLLSHSSNTSSSTSTSDNSALLDAAADTSDTREADRKSTELSSFDSPATQRSNNNTNTNNLHHHHQHHNHFHHNNSNHHHHLQVTTATASTNPHTASTTPGKTPPQAGTLAPGGSLPPLVIGVAPLVEGENDNLTAEEDDHECSACSCSCSENEESSVYAEADFADEVRATLQELGGCGGRHLSQRRRRPRSTYSTDSNYDHLNHDTHDRGPALYPRPMYPSAAAANSGNAASSAGKTRPPETNASKT